MLVAELAADVDGSCDLRQLACVSANDDDSCGSAAFLHVSSNQLAASIFLMLVDQFCTDAGATYLINTGGAGPVQGTIDLTVQAIDDDYYNFYGATPGLFVLVLCCLRSDRIFIAIAAQGPAPCSGPVVRCIPKPEAVEAMAMRGLNINGQPLPVSAMAAGGGGGCPGSTVNINFQGLLAGAGQQQP